MIRYVVPISFSAVNGTVISAGKLSFNFPIYDLINKNVNSVTGNLVSGTPTDPVVNAAVSADAGNATTLGSDGLPYTPQGAANLVFYPTTASSDIIGYNKLVTNVTDPDYNTVAVDVSTGVISGLGILISELAAAPGVFIGNPGVITISTIGEIRRIAGTGTAEFYFEAYLRDSGGIETLVGTSNLTPPVNTVAYTQFQAALLLNNGVWGAGDRLVLKFYANRVSGGSNPSFEILFGGMNPVRTLFPVPASLISTGAKEIRHSFVAPFSYMGTAPSGTAESAPVWDITRIEYLSGGYTDIKTATGAWTNRYSLIYT